MKKDDVIVEQVYNAPVEKVWKALTDREQMKQWYFDIAAFKPEVGFEFSFTGQGKDCETYIHLCRITEVVFEKKLVYSWRYEGFEGNSLVSFELFPEGDKTRLTLTHSALETFPSGHPAFLRENFAEGWTHIVQTSLKNFVEN